MPNASKKREKFRETPMMVAASGNRYHDLDGGLAGPIAS
jgi:hypothetical protein